MNWLTREQDRLFLWLPVLLGTGIGLHFSWAGAPSAGLAAPVAAGLALTAAALRARVGAALLAAGLAAVLAGLALADWRTRTVAAPVLARETGPVDVTGRLVRLSPLAPAGHRAVIAPEELGGLAARQIPARIRVNIRTRIADVRPGDQVRIRAGLRPPPGPVAPGAFDFARQAWFDRLGAVGYAVGPLQRAPPAPGGAAPGLSGALERLRMRLTTAIRDALPPTQGAVAAALMTGERGAIPPPVMAAMRDAGLAHLLAISGLHMALFAGALFWVARGALALAPGLALRAPIKKWSAVIALAGAAGYLAVSGASVATQRAFVMFALVILAVLLDRPALTLRNVAWAALAVLVLAPESLVEAGFQMSFAAATALVAFYEGARPHLARWNAALAARGPMMRPLLYASGVALTSIIASAATAPFAAYHFNRVVDFGLVANLVAVPVTGAVVMPAALAAFLAMPFGLEAGPLWVAGQGIEVILATARMVAGWPGAVTRVPAMPAAALVLLVLGGLWVGLWRARLRWLGLAFAASGIVVAAAAPAPVLLVEREGQAVALRDGDGALSLSTPRRGRFSAAMWLRRDGDGRSPAAAHPGVFRCDALGCVARHQALGLVAHATSWRAVMEDCPQADILITPLRAPARCHAPVTIDRAALKARGAHAAYLAGGRMRLVSVCDVSGPRPWNRCR